MKKLNPSSVRISNLLVAAVLVLVPFHAFLTVWLSSAVGHFVALRLWDELALIILSSICFVWLLQNNSLGRKLFESKLSKLIIAYILLTLLLGLIALLRHEVGLKALGYGLIINLRFIIWFICVLLVSQRSVWLRTNWEKLVLWPLLVIIIFGIMQFFILPHDFLSHFGYNSKTYVPFVTINQDTSTMRVQSFLRGANPLGAYLASIGVIVSLVYFWQKRKFWWLLLPAIVLVLFLSFSRSAWIGAIISGVTAVGLMLRAKQQKRTIIASFLISLFMLSVGFLLLRHNSSVQNAVLHVSDRSTAEQTSNEGHIESLHESLQTIVNRPFGSGPGAAGQASWYNTSHPIRNTESYLLQIGEEIGWPGLVLFLGILFALGMELWRRKNNALAFGLLVSLCGLLLISLLAYAWSDDSLAYVWWGLAGIALSYSPTLQSKSTIGFGFEK